MSRYSKLLAAVAGNVVAIGLITLSFNGVATCTPDVEPSLSTCSLWGFSGTQILAGLQMALAGLFVERAPANQP